MRVGLVRSLLRAAVLFCLANVAVAVWARSPLGAALPAASLLVVAVGFRVLAQGHVRLAMQLVIYMSIGLSSASNLLEVNHHTSAVGQMILAILTFAITVLEGRRVGAPVALLSALSSIGVTTYINLFGPHPVTEDPRNVAGLVVLQVILIVAAWYTAGYAWAINQSAVEGLQVNIAAMERVVAESECIAEGDLSRSLEGDDRGTRIVAALQAGLRTLVARAQESATTLTATTAELSASSNQQQAGAVKQAAAVTEVKEMLVHLADASRSIAAASRDVLQNAESTLGTNHEVALRFDAWSSQAERVTALLASIRTVAQKSELIALNAGLEGVRAGEAGRGFALISAEMQRLATQVADTARHVDELVGAMGTSKDEALVAVASATTLAEATADAARTIAQTTETQRRTAEEVTATVEDVEQVTREVAIGSGETRQSVEDLSAMGKQLTDAVNAFRL